eukprot:1787412-Rhodomonas_salina.2
MALCSFGSDQRFAAPPVLAGSPVSAHYLSPTWGCGVDVLPHAVGAQTMRSSTSTLPRSAGVQQLRSRIGT